MQTQIKIRSLDGYEIPAVLHHPAPDHEHVTDVNFVVLGHGIFSDKDEHDRFIRQAELHVENGSQAIRFDFRGHGEHPVPSRDVTIGGMMVDFHSVLKYARSRTTGSIFVVASSFGASILLLYLQSPMRVRPDRIVLLNPVVDYRATMLQAVLPWGRELFSPKGYDELEQTGYITLEEGFKMRAEMVMEMSAFRPYDSLKSLDIPTRIIHGDMDSKVPYSLARFHSLESTCVDFQTIPGADHAFKTPEHETKSFELIRDWLYPAEGK